MESLSACFELDLSWLTGKRSYNDKAEAIEGFALFSLKGFEAGGVAIIDRNILFVDGHVEKKGLVQLQFNNYEIFMNTKPWIICSDGGRELLTCSRTTKKPIITIGFLSFGHLPKTYL